MESLENGWWPCATDETPLPCSTATGAPRADGVKGHRTAFQSTLRQTDSDSGVLLLL